MVAPPQGSLRVTYCLFKVKHYGWHFRFSENYNHYGIQFEMLKKRNKNSEWSWLQLLRIVRICNGVNANNLPMKKVRVWNQTCFNNFPYWYPIISFLKLPLFFPMNVLLASTAVILNSYQILVASRNESCNHFCSILTVS